MSSFVFEAQTFRGWDMKQYQLVAAIIRSRGVKGEVEVHSMDGLPLNLRPNSILHIVPPLLEGVRVTRIVSERGTEQAPWLRLEGVNDRNAATLLIGRYLLADVEDCLDSDQVNETLVRHDWLPHEVVGLEVFDSSKGFIGTIVEESRATPQILWTLQGPFGLVLLPAVEAFIKSFDDRSVQVQIPDGLLELNK
jgi:16S rRNA processing protein RimM